MKLDYSPYLFGIFISWRIQKKFGQEQKLLIRTTQDCIRSVTWVGVGVLRVRSLLVDGIKAISMYAYVRMGKQKICK